MADRAREKEPEFNPRWKGYVYILVSSLVNYASISNLEIEDNPGFNGHYQISLIFGITTFGLSVLVLVLDRFQSCCNISDDFNYTKAKDGKVEGYTLAAITFFWIVGVAHITQVDGIAYVATNIYFSSWLALFSCIFTLDKWSEAKDILSIEELTGLSATLKSWYVLFLASLVVMGTSCDIHSQLADQFKSSAAYGITLGLGSTLVALFFIMVHYRFIDFEFLQVGGWIELSASFGMILLWVVGVAILTSEGGIAATMGGSGCTAIETTFDYPATNKIDECYVTWTSLEEEEEEAESSQDSPPAKPPPSSTNPPTRLPKEETDQPTVLPTTATSVPQSVFCTTDVQECPDGSFVGRVEPDCEFEACPETLASAPSSSPSQSGSDYEFESSISSAPTDSESASSAIMSPAPSAEDVSTAEPTITGSSQPTSNAPTTPPLANLNNNNTNLTVPDDDDDALFEGDGDLGDDDIEGLMSINDTDVNIFNITFNSTVNGTLSNPTNVEDDPTRWLQEVNTNGNPNESTTHWTAVPAAGPTTTTTISSGKDPSSPPTTTDYRYTQHQRHCNEILDQQIPGSNLYLACWICFFASFNVTLRWKAAQAIQFAQAQHRKADERAGLAEEDLNASDRDNDDASDVSDSHTNGDDKL